MGLREGDVPSAARLVERLPEPYVRLLAHVVAGHTDRAIAADLGVDVAVVPALVRLATAKLLAMLQAVEVRQVALRPANR